MKIDINILMSFITCILISILTSVIYKAITIGSTYNKCSGFTCYDKLDVCTTIVPKNIKVGQSIETICLPREITLVLREEK